MLIIAHRGNTIGPDPANENKIEHLKKAIALGYDVEVDVWYEDGQLFTGHDTPTYVLSDSDFSNIVSRAWFHCKNSDAIEYLSNHNLLPNFFWHESDDYTLTSHKFIWTYPHMKATDRSIAVLPEVFSPDRKNLSNFYGVCTDYCIEFDPSQPQ